MEATQEQKTQTTVQDTPRPQSDQPPPVVQPASQQEKALNSLLNAAVDETIRRQAQSMALETAQIEQDGRIALMMFHAGLYDDLKNCTPQQATARALVKIELGRTMGIGPFEAMNVIYFVNGRPSLDSGVRAARMKRAGYSWEVIKQDDKGCILLLMKDGKYIMRPVVDQEGKFQYDDSGNLLKEPVVCSFLEADAQRAGLLQKSGSLYKTYPKIMYFNRCISGAQKTFAPEVLNGSDMVSREEAEEMDPMPIGGQMPQGTYEAAKDVLRDKLAQFDTPRESDPPASESSTQEADPKPDPEPTKTNGATGGLFSEGLTGAKKK